MQAPSSVSGGVDFTYQEKTPGSPVYTFANAQSRVERTFTCPWKNRHDLVRFLIGYPKIVNNAGQSYLSRLIPDAMLDCPVPVNDDNWLFATSIVRMVGMGETGTYDANNIAQYQTAVVTVSYEPRTFKIVTDDHVLNGNGVPDESLFGRYVTKTQKPSAEFIQLPRGLMKWYDWNAIAPQNKPTPVDYATARLITTTEFAITWHEVPFIPDAILDPANSFVGCLNKQIFVMGQIDDGSNQFKYQPGTLLLLAAEVKPYRMASGSFVQDITYRMKHMDNSSGLGRGHNFFMRKDPQAGKLMYTKLTEDGANDSVAIIPDSVANGPYNPGSPKPVPLAAGTSVAVYAYAGFNSLFSLNIAAADNIIGRPQ